MPNKRASLAAATASTTPQAVLRAAFIAPTPRTERKKALETDEE
jgi:hypothetical protein